MDAWGLTQSHCSQWKGFHQFQKALDQTGISYLFWDVAWILITGALYTNYKSCCSHRGCYSWAAHSSEAGFENYGVFCEWLLAVHRVIKMRVCQCCQQQCDTVKSKVVIGKLGWRLGSAYLYQQSLFAPLLGWNRQAVLGRQAGLYLNCAPRWSVDTW